ncbi:MAG: autotransporter outer membrane beta-barrel domain-containing protein [Deltaproteobacteria bacterium]|jgi:hypothetical protein|nr:autotransporter outer membrane beta-barrel domain-containing protein [Deltaproteobacteria bacterium]
MQFRTALGLSAGLILVFAAAGAAFAAPAGEYQREMAFRDLMLKSQASALHAPSGGDGGLGVDFSIIPEWDYVHHDDLTGTIDGTDLKMDAGTSRSYCLIFIAGKQLTDWFKLSFLYKYGYTDYKAGLLVPDMDMFSGRSDVHLASHLVGFIGNFTNQTLGNFEVSVMEAWDIYAGNETMYIDDGEGNVIEDKRSVGSFDDRVFSFIAWWDKDFSLSDSWKIDPYVGWRTVQVVLNDMNDFAGAPGTFASDSSVVNLVSYGLKFKYNSGLWGFSVRGGVNHRLEKDPVPGFASRAVAPNATNLGFMSTWDRTVGTWGLGFSYVLPETMVIAVNYDGAAGPSAIMHTATAAFVFLF